MACLLRERMRRGEEGDEACRVLAILAGARLTRQHHRRTTVPGLSLSAVSADRQRCIGGTHQNQWQYLSPAGQGELAAHQVAQLVDGKWRSDGVGGREDAPDPVEAVRVATSSITSHACRMS